MSALDSDKRAAAAAGAALVASGMTIGLGSGSTAALFVVALGARVREEGLEVAGVPTSEATAELAKRVGVRLVGLDDVATLDLDVDGADEVDPGFRMIKGRGGALLREKIVAAASRRRVILVTASKRVARLGDSGAPVPVEVSPFGTAHTVAALQGLGCRTSVRNGKDGRPFTTDEGHRIVDCAFGPIDDPEGLERRLKSIVGVFETGLFLGLCDTLLVGRADGTAERVDRPA